MANTLHHFALIIPAILITITGCFDSTTKFDTQSSSSQSSYSHLTITDASVSSAKSTNTISTAPNDSFIIDSLTTTLHSLNKQITENQEKNIVSKSLTTQLIDSLEQRIDSLLLNKPSSNQLSSSYSSDVSSSSSSVFVWNPIPGYGTLGDQNFAPDSNKTLIISGLPIYEVASITTENSSGVFKNRFWLWGPSNTMRGVVNYFEKDPQSGIQYSFQIYEEDATNFLEVKFNADKEILTKYYHYDETGEFILSWPSQPLNPYDTRSPEEIVYHSRNYWMPDDSLGGLCAVSHKNSLTDPNCIEIDKHELMKWLNEKNHPELPGWSWSSNGTNELSSNHVSSSAISSSTP